MTSVPSVAATRVGVGDTAFPHRVDGYNLVVLSEWMEPANTDRCIAWARQTYSEMEPFVASGLYVNYLGDDETGDPTAAATGPTIGGSRSSRRSTIRQFLPHQPEHSPIVLSQLGPTRYLPCPNACSATP